MNGKDGNMTKILSSKQRLNQLLAEHYQEAQDAKEAGRPVAWATSIFPQEILEAMGFAIVYPENHAAAIGARKDAPQFLKKAESDGYSIDNCSYARINLAYAELLHSDAANIPVPDLICCCSNICLTTIKWYENLAKHFNCPMIIIDTPSGMTDDISEERVRYIRGQLEEAIVQLEEIAGKKFDYDKFKDVMRISNETATWWLKATDLLKHKPSPAMGFDMFNYMAPIVCFRGIESGRLLFKQWYEELEKRIENGQGPWDDQEEKFRVLWDGIPCWPYLSSTYKVLKKNGINMVTSTYPESWSLLYDVGDLDGMARAYGSLLVQRSMDHGVRRLCRLASEFNVDGAIFHSNRSCKGMDFKQFEIARQLKLQYGVPSVFFDGDQTDPSAFSIAQYETRVQALLEMMASNVEKGDR